MNEIAIRKNVLEYVDKYDEVIQNIRKINKEIENINSTFCDLNIRVYNNYNTILSSEKNIFSDISRSFWIKIIEISEIKKVMSSSQIEKLDKQIDSPNLPEFNYENVITTILTLHNSIISIVERSVKDVYDYLRPIHVMSQSKKFKTNKVYELGKKVIIPNVFEYSFSFLSMNDYRRSILRDIEKVFFVLDGKGSIGFNEDIVSKINNKIIKNEYELETEYFYLKWYKAGNLHITFKREDLVQKFNQIASNNNELKG